MWKRTLSVTSDQRSAQPAGNLLTWRLEVWHWLLYALFALLALLAVAGSLHG